jgi:hypothetical protein
MAVGEAALASPEQHSSAAVNAQAIAENKRAAEAAQFFREIQS